MQIVRSGVTRNVILTKRYAIKVPCRRWGSRAPWKWIGPLVRGWLANQSEWRQRHRRRVNPPLFTLFHFATWYRRAEEVSTWDTDNAPQATMRRYRVEERKGSSWGRFGRRWLLIDYDRCWERPWGLVARFYYWPQERMFRKWAKVDS